MKKHYPRASINVEDDGWWTVTICFGGNWKQADQLYSAHTTWKEALADANKLIHQERRRATWNQHYKFPPDDSGYRMVKRRCRQT